MYFGSRTEAGYRLAMQLFNYRYENTAVVALSDGGVQVGQQIAAQLHSPLSMLLVDNIEIPGEDMSFGSLNQSGRFSYNGMLSAGQIEAFYSEFHGQFEDQKREKMSRMNQLLGQGGIVSEDMLRGRNVMLVSDGLHNGSSIEAASNFLKPLTIEKMIVACPIASVSAVDTIHILADEVHILGVTDNFLDTDHYYDVNDVPGHDQTIAMLNDIVLNWH